MDDTDAQATDAWPELERIAQPARDRRRLAPVVRSAIIAELCAIAALSVKELSALLDRSEAYIGDAIRPLVSGGELTFMYPDQPRHPKQKYISRKPQPRLPALAFEPPDHSPLPPATPVEPKLPEPAMARYAARSEAQDSIDRRQVQRDSEVARPPAEEPASKGRAFPNQWTNAAIVVIVGIALAQWHTALWPLLTAVAGAALAFSHVAANSIQYHRFRSLHRDGMRGRIFFVLLKGGVAWLEITLVYFATGAFHGTS